jgi:predicted ABC-type ATPase
VADELSNIHLEPTALNKARVKQRTEEGGHTVPEDKIENRIPRLLEYIKIEVDSCSFLNSLLAHSGKGER